MLTKADQGMTRALNRRLILDLLRREGPRSRAEIAAATGLSPAAVTSVVGALLAGGHVLEGKAVSGASGRRPIPIAVNYANGLAVGFKLMVGAAECVVTDLATEPLASMRLDLPTGSPEDVAHALAAAVPSLMERAGRAGARLAGIGVSMPGVIDREQRTCLRSHRFGWSDVPLASMLAHRAGVPAWLEDDTNAYAIAQQLFGLGRKHRNMAVLAIGAGISCAIVIDNKLYRGAHGAAGKLGHTLHEAGGRLCECGKRGCLLAYYSQPGLLRTWEERRGPIAGNPLAAMTAALADREPAILELLEEAGASIGGALANLVNVVDPEIVVVGGEAVALGAAFLEPMRRRLAEQTFRTAPPLLPDWEDDSWARGAAALVTQKLFDFESDGGTLGSSSEAPHRLD